MLDRMPERMPDRMSGKCQKECQIYCQNICQIECHLVGGDHLEKVILEKCPGSWWKRAETLTNE